MPFARDPASAANLRRAGQGSLAHADDAMAKPKQYASQFNLGYDATRISERDAGLSNLKSLEDKVEQLNESKTAQGTAQAYDTFQNQILPLEKSLSAMSGDLGQSQMSQPDAEILHLQR